MAIITTIHKDLSFFKELLANLQAVIFTLDLNTETYNWNINKYFDIFGYTEDEIFNKDHEFADHYFLPEYKHLVNEWIESFRNKNRITWSGVYRIKHKKGHWVWGFSRVMVFKYDDRGNPTMLLGIVMDASESIDTQEQIIRLYTERIRSRNQLFIKKLTKRELEIIKMIAAGDCYPEIAKKLNIQPVTVNKHRKSILDKLDLKNIASLLHFVNDTEII